MKNQKLPVDDYRVQIIETVKNNQVVIITAETGAGKSTRVPQFLLDEGYSLVVTQPRRLAARSVAKRVAQERGCELGAEIGFRTAYERQDGPKTRCLFATDGLALVRELMGVERRQILILDEIHEWNLNMEVLVAWSKRQINSGANFKLVIMSATLEADKLSEFFDKAPVVSVPGRCYPVEEREPSKILDDVLNLLNDGRNVLVFQPGKAEITEMISDLKAKKVNAEILSLHGELEAEDQDRVFRSYSLPKCVIATNVAQTSITIEDIDAVVDSGTERRIELNNGVEGLYLMAISLADRDQRKGRAGRCREGIYIDHCSYKIDERLKFPKAEILRVRLDQTVLRLAEAKIDAEELSFFHQPPLDQIHEAKRALHALGCMDENRNVTPIGRQVARLPISVQYGRMVVEAERLEVVDDIIDIAAILEQGGVTARKVVIDDEEYSGEDLWRPAFCPAENESDPMAQLAVFRGARNLTNEERRVKGIFIKSYYQARERRQLLADSLKGKVRSFRSSGKREDILKAMSAGMVDHLYKYSYGEWVNGDGYQRKLSNESIVRSADWLVGLPFDVTTRRGLLRLVTMATKVNPLWLAEAAPQLTKREEGINPRYDETLSSCVSTTKIFFNEVLIKEEELETPNHPQAEEVRQEYLVRIESERIEKCWREKRQEIESGWVSNPEQVYSCFPKLLSSVVITRKDNDQGEKIFAYISLHSDSYSDFRVKLCQTLEEAEIETKLGLERLFKKAGKDFFAVPNEEPWTESGYWSKPMTDLGKALQTTLQQIIENSLVDISVKNFQSRLEQAKGEAEKARAEIEFDWSEKKIFFNDLEETISCQLSDSENYSLISSEVNKLKTDIANLKLQMATLCRPEFKEFCKKILGETKELATLSTTRVNLKNEAEEKWPVIRGILHSFMYGHYDFFYASDDDRHLAEVSYNEIYKDFYANRYEKVLERIPLAQVLVEKIENRISILKRILESEYSICPICQEKVDFKSTHYCGEDYEAELSVLEDGEAIKETFAGKDVLVSLVYDSQTKEFNVLVNSETFDCLTASSEVLTKSFYEVSDEEKSLRDQIRSLGRLLSAIEREKNVSNRVVVCLSEGLDPKGNKQLQAEANFSGRIDNKKEENGYSEYDNQLVIFVINANSQSWLEELPQPEQIWSCKPAFQISMKNGKPIIVVNPQLRLDQENVLKEDLAKLQREENKLSPEVDIDQINALKAAWGSR